MQAKSRRTFAKLTVPVLALALAACQTQMPTGSDATGEKNLSVGKNLGTNTPGAKPGTTAEAGSALPDAGLPSREETLGAATPMAIKAAEGGMYKSGDLEAIIPPGALTQDATVRFGAVDTSNFKPSAIYIPGLLFAMDLGDAQLKSGQAIMVKGKVDQRFVDEFKKLAPGADPADRGLSQAEDGTWYLTMPVKNMNGADAEQVQATELGAESAVVEMMPIVQGDRTVLQAPEASASASPTPAPTPTPEPTLTPRTTGDPVIDSYPAMPVSQAPSHSRIGTMTVHALGHTTVLTVGNTVAETMAAGSIPEYIHCFIAHGWCSGDGIHNAIGDVIRYNKAIAANRLPPSSLTSRARSYRNWDCTTASTPLTDVTLKAVYFDENGANRPETPSNVTMVVNAAGNVLNHAAPAGSVTFRAGLDRAFTIYGFVNAPTLPVYAQSAPQNIVTADGMAAVTVRIPKKNPKITLNIDSEAVLPETVTLTYELNGAQATHDFNLAGAGAGSRAASVSFHAVVPGVAKYSFKLLGLGGGELTDDHNLPAVPNVYYNFEHTANVKMIGAVPK